MTTVWLTTDPSIDDCVSIDIITEDGDIIASLVTDIPVDDCSAAADDAIDILLRDIGWRTVDQGPNRWQVYEMGAFADVERY